MQISLYSDASFRNGKGTWAGCAVLDNVVGFEIEEKIKKCHSINYAELYAVHKLLKQAVSEYSTNYTFSFFTDSMSVVRWMTTQTPPKHPTSAKIYHDLVADIRNHNLNFYISHIKSITPNYFFRNCHSRAKTLNIY